MFRCVELPPGVSGKLFLYSMPGRYEALDRVWQQLRTEAVGVMVSLVESDELQEKSPEYARAILAGTVPCALLAFEIPERGAPADRDGFWALAVALAKRLARGEAVLIHCAGGVGRTALLAISVLLALGCQTAQARNLVSRAGATVETAAQSQLVAWCASRVGC